MNCGSSLGALELAIKETARNSGVRLDLQGKSKSLRKFGYISNLGTTRRTVSNLPEEEVYSTTNDITTIVSSDASDTETMRVEGFTVDGSGDFTYVDQTVTLNGQTPVALGTAIARHIETRNQGAVDLVGEINVYEGGAITAGVPDDAAGVHDRILAGDQSSMKASTTMGKDEYLLITEVAVAVLLQENRNVDFFLEVREKGGVFHVVEAFSVTSQGESLRDEFNPAIVVPANADVRLRAVASGAFTGATGSFAGYLATSWSQ